MNFTQGYWAKLYQLALQSLLRCALCVCLYLGMMSHCAASSKRLGEWEEIQDFLQKCGKCDKFETCTPLRVGARLESDTWIAVITGVRSRSLWLFEISLILTFGGSLISFSCVWKGISSNRRFLSARGKMDTNTSEIFCLVWGQLVDEILKKRNQKQKNIWNATIPWR